MLLYLDESGIDGISKDIFVGGILTGSKVDKNIIKQTIIKSFKKAPKIPEYKYNERLFDDKIKYKVVKEITSKYKYIYTKIPAGLDSHTTNISKCIANIIDSIDSIHTDNKDTLDIIYDKTTLKINKQTIDQYIRNKKINFTFKMLDSKNEFGLQCADWIVGATRSDKLKDPTL